MPVFPTLQGPDLEQEAEKSTFAVFLEYIETMRYLLFFLMSLCAACTAITSCSRTNDTVLAARQQAWLDLILSTHNSSDEKDVRLLDSINRLALKKTSACSIPLTAWRRLPTATSASSTNWHKPGSPPRRPTGASMTR